MRARFFVSVLACVALQSCVTYREQLNRGQRLYEENQYERALALLRNLDGDVDSLSSVEQSRYYYLRGMTDYRLGYRAEARHFLATAQAADALQPGGLIPEWQERMRAALAELNHDVYGGDGPSPDVVYPQPTSTTPGTSPTSSESSVSTP
ncbi:MAG TPA: hypothetical protein VFQ61_18150 [Polyangiaceae bacterium]|nr:hypothetical protein [Polyangiaceae bacterium]